MTTELFPIVRRARRPLINPEEPAMPQFEKEGIPDYDKPVRDRVKSEDAAAKKERDRRLQAARQSGVKLPIGTVTNIAPTTPAPSGTPSDLPPAPVNPAPDSQPEGQSETPAAPTTIERPAGPEKAVAGPQTAKAGIRAKTAKGAKLKRAKAA